MKISAVIAIRDEKETYLRTLTSLSGFADEILVADIGMTREMRDCVERMRHVKLVTIREPVPYIEIIRQRLIDMCSHTWILYLDPDEEITDELKSFFKRHIDDYDYFSIPRKNIILNHWMRYSRWWPDRQIRFFKRQAVTWGTVIHSQPECTGLMCEVPSVERFAIVHNNYLSYDQYAEKSRRYARAEAESHMKHKDFTLLSALRLGTSEFMSRFYAEEGYKDGMHGLIMAFSQYFYYFQVYIYYWEMNQYDAGKQQVNTVPLKLFTHGLHESIHWAKVKGLIHEPLKKFNYKLVTLLTRQRDFS